jgi:outer membrane protein OmpA-like peptidoglycan-associated protein
MAIEAAAHKRLPSVDLEVYFAYNSAAIEPQAVSQLKTLGQALRDDSLADDAFLIAGHTDAKGGARFNLDLSRRRAEAVRLFLIANFGIDRAKLVARGFGATHLKNSDVPLSAENRRVQIVNLSKEVPR